jgi:cholesterol oxidase
MGLMRRRMIVLLALGMTPPLGRLVHRGAGRLEVELPMSEDLRRYHDDTLELLHSIMRRNGCRVVDAELVHGDGQPYHDVGFSSAHHVGSCRMADTRSRGVVDPGGEVFGHPGLYVSDGAAIPGSLAVNTSLTILANAERIAGLIARRYRAAEPIVLHAGAR